MFYLKIRDNYLPNFCKCEVTTITFPAYSNEAGTAIVMSNLSLPVDLDSDSNASRIS